MDLTSRKRSACDRCRKLKVACRKPDPADEVCERCLRAGFECITEQPNATLQAGVASQPLSLVGANQPTAQPLPVASGADEIMHDELHYFRHSDSRGGTDSALYHDTTLSEFISAFAGTQTDIPISSASTGFTPNFPGPLHIDTEQQVHNVSLDASHPANKQTLLHDGPPVEAELDRHADHVLWDISRQLARFRDTPWDPRTVRLGWLDVDFSTTGRQLTPSEELVAISLRYTTLTNLAKLGVQILGPTNRVTVKLMVLSTYVELTHAMNCMLADVGRYVQDVADSPPSASTPGGSSNGGSLQPRHHMFALVRIFECQLGSMEALLGLPPEYRASTGDGAAERPGIFGHGDSAELVSAVMGQQRALGGPGAVDQVQSLRATIEQVRSYLRA